jgi:tryptophanyl-tRNA synthetase
MDKKIILSGIKPTGIPTLGNYIGALRNWREMQQDDKYCYYMVADMHALTVRNDPEELRQQTRSMAALLIACGIDPNRSPLFIQSHVHQHAELSWLLGCTTYMGELNRMTQFKDKSAKHADNINAGLFTYPVLMAADILLYQTDVVPVGADQKQHLEICRDIAERFNGVYGDVFRIPEPYISKSSAARIMSLNDPRSKMSKSGDPESFISMADGPDDVRRKLRRAVTDSDGEIRMDPENKPGVSNLIAICAAMSGTAPEDVCASLQGKGYGALKDAAAEAVNSVLAPIQAEQKRLLSDRQYIAGVLKDGSERASALAIRTLRKVYKKVGLYQL